MGPGRPTPDFAYRRRADAKARRDGLGRRAFRTKPPDLPHPIFGQFREAVLRAFHTSGSPPLVTITVVVGNGAKFQVSGVHAPRRIASVANDQAIRDRPVSQHVTDPMRPVCPVAANEPAVASRSRFSLPEPAGCRSVAAVYVLPELCLNLVSHHARSLSQRYSNNHGAFSTCSGNDRPAIFRGSLDSDQAPSCPPRLLRLVAWCSAIVRRLDTARQGPQSPCRLRARKRPDLTPHFLVIDAEYASRFAPTHVVRKLLACILA